MGLSDYKFKEANFNGRKIADLSNTPSSDGMTAEDLKAYFDYIPKTMIAMGVINSIIDLLESAEGAGNIGGNVTGLTGTTVQEILESAKTLIDNRYTKETVDGMLDEKAEKTVVEGLIKSVSFDAATGTFTFTEEGGTVHTFDTALEKVAVNFTYDASAQALVLNLADGTTQTISLAEFITVNEIEGSDAVNVSTSGGVTTISIKNGSITDSMLSSSLLAAAREYASAASLSASNAAASEANAKTYANQAATSAANAATSETNAAAYESSAKTAKTAAEAAQVKAEEAAQKAEDIAGGDFVTTDEMKEYVDSIMTVDDTTEV